MTASVVDLFCGAGGLSYGLQKSGLEVVVGVDNDPRCQVPYCLNNQASFILSDIREVKGETLEPFWKSGTRILVGCAPCQTFSTYARGSRLPSEDDSRWSLISEFARLVTESRPDIVSMENVPRAKESIAFQSFVKILENLEFHVWFNVVRCEEYGVPQKRQRLVLMASKHGQLMLKNPNGTRIRTVREAISHLEPIYHGQASESDPVHYACKLSEKNLSRVRISKQGGSWQEWPDELKLKCHKRASGRTYRSVYGRMEFDAPAPTLTTLCTGVGNGRYTHPTQDRGISLREAALLQTFPETYRFVAAGQKVQPRVIAKLIGNAVPVNLAHAIGDSILDHLNVQETR